MSKKWGLEDSVDSDEDGFIDATEETEGTSPIDPANVPSFDLSNAVDEQIGESSGLDDVESNLALWLDASNIDGSDNSTLRDGDAVSQWMDLSGNLNNAQQADTNYRPAYQSNAYVICK